MKRTLREEVQLMERYFGLPPDPRRDQLLALLDTWSEREALPQRERGEVGDQVSASAGPSSPRR